MIFLKIKLTAGLYQKAIWNFLCFYRFSSSLWREIKLAKMIISFIALTNSTYFLSNSGKTYSCSDICKNKVPVSFVLTLVETNFPHLSQPVHTDKDKHSIIYSLRLESILNFSLVIITTIFNYPPGMPRRSDVSFRSYIGWDVADHAKTSSRRRKWYVNETDLFETSLQRLTGT